MSTIVTRSGKGSPLTHTEVDDNFTNLNTDKYQEGSAIGAVTPAAGTFTTLTATGQTSLGGAAGSESLRVTPVASAVNYLNIYGRATSLPPRVFAEGSDASIGISFSTKGSSPMLFSTNTGTQQFAVSHTASAVNYVQVTGAATTARPVISAQGSDTNIALGFDSKGTGAHIFRTNGLIQSQILNTASAVNYTTQTGSATGASPVLGVGGTDTNIDLTLTPKGTGNVRFGTFTANADAPITGYITIKDSGGTVRKLAVIA